MPNLAHFKRRVIYADTDHFGVMYHSRYLEWMEAGRAELLRVNNLSYAAYEKQGMFAPVVKLEIEYLKPVQYDEEVTVETSLESIGETSLTFSYTIKRGEEIVSKAKTINVFVKKIGEKTRVPDEVRNILTS